MARYYTVTIDADSDYPTLSGPRGFECTLTEPEDRNWNRDLRPVVERLEEYENAHDKVVALLEAAELARQILNTKRGTYIYASTIYEVGSKLEQAAQALRTAYGMEGE